MVNCEVNIRNEFFISALFVENMITTYLSDKINVNSIVRSNFSENNENDLSFYQKIEFIIESEELSIIDNSKLSVYREIYTELLNNKNAETFEDCFTSNDGNDDFLLILYPQSDLISREEKITNACYQLIEEASELIANFTNKPEIKLRKSIFNFNAAIYSKVAMLLAFLFLK